MTTVTVPGRFRGPADSANGGVTAGLLADHLDADTVEVTLRHPPPLDTPLELRHGPDGSATLVHDGTVVAEARPGDLDVALPAAVPVDAATEAARRSRWRDPDLHPYPQCFVCGPARAPGDGLGIFAGPVGDTDLFAAPWTPGHDDAGPDGKVRAELIWAALDCPTGFAVMPPDALSILGRITARVDMRPPVGDPLVVVAWALGVEGRKQHAASALHTAAGELVGLARATWIALN